jgi:hypothetical protein
MSDSRNVKKSQNAMQAAEAVESTEFTGILGSNVNPKWFDWLMQHSGTYLFTAALFLSILKLGISIYQYVKSLNKNVNENVSLGWAVLQTTMLSTAIIGTLVAAATIFSVVTPALFVASMAADTLRNLGFLFWNIGKLASLRFQVRKKLKEKDPLTELKYEALKEKYIEKINAHAVGSAVGLVMTTAVSIIFLFPHIGLTAIGAAVVGKITVAGIAGIAAAGALTIPLLPTVYRLAKWGLPKIGNGIRNAVKKVYSFFESKFSKDEIITNENPNKNQEQQQQPLIQNTKPMRRPLLPTTKHPSFEITNETALNDAISHELPFSAFTQHSRFRETIIDHINNKELATIALQKMVNEKINSLEVQMNEGGTSGFRYFAEKQRPKRIDKLTALKLIKLHLDDIDDNIRKSDDIMDLIKIIESYFPGVKESFFLDQSDTQNIIEALKVYAYKFFPEHANNNVL